MKKILFVMPNLRGGGAEKVLIDVLRNIDKSKFDITLLLFNKGEVYDDQIPKNINVKCINDIMKFIPSRIWGIIAKYYPRLFYKFIIKEEYDIEIAFMEGLATRFVANSNNKDSKKVAWVHIDLLKKHWTKNMFLKGKEEECYNEFNDLVFVSNDAKTAFNNLFKVNKPNKHVIYNPIISHEIEAKSREKNITFKEFTILSVGRLDYQKGYDRLIKVHKDLVKVYPHKLIILGEGPERGNLEKLIETFNVENSVELKGFIKNPYPYIKAADLFICSSRQEGYSLVVAESMVLEKPIISTNITGPREVLNDGEYGSLCRNSEDGIKETLKEVLENRKLLDVYKEKSIKGKKSLDYKSIINDIEKLLSY